MDSVSIILIVFLFLMGLGLGSFANALVYRLHAGKSVMKGRSMCLKCKKTLKTADLIPVASFILLSGRCRYCKQKISIQYPLVEIAAAVLFAALGIYFLSLENIPAFSLIFFILLALYCFYAVCMIIIFVSDLRFYIIPDKVVISAIVAAIIANIFIPGMDYISAFYGAGAAGFFFLILVLISRGKWMGWGDVKFAFLMGAILGWPSIVAGLFIAFVAGAVVSLLLILFKKKKFHDIVPFGVFLSGAAIVAVFYGNRIIDWYLNLIGI